MLLIPHDKKVGETLGPAANLEKVSTRFPDPCLSGNLAGKRPLDCFWIYLFQAKYIFYIFFLNVRGGWEGSGV